jgi:serine/threonine-protein kinase RsbW
VNDRVSISIASIRSNIRLVEQFLLDLREGFALTDAEVDRILVSVTEAVNNGIVHGNRLDPEKLVHLTCHVYSDRLQFEIRDEGNGFAPEDVPNPLDEANLLKEGGRGLHIIKSLMDSVEFSRKPEGMTLSLTLVRAR